MKTFKSLALVAAVSAGLLNSTVVMAERQGDIGPTSDGDFDIFLSVGDQVQIWGFKDLYFANGKSSDDMSLCVKNNHSNAQVRLSVEGAFKLGDPATDGANYSVTIADNNAEKTSTWGTKSGQLGSGYSSVEYKTAISNDLALTESCADNSTYHAVDLTVQVEDLKGTGAWSDQVTVTVFPIQKTGIKYFF